MYILFNLRYPVHALFIFFAMLSFTCGTNISYATPPNFAASAFKAAALAVKLTYAPKHPVVKFPINDSTDYAIILPVLAQARGQLMQTGKYQSVDYDFSENGNPFFAEEIIRVSPKLLITVYMIKMHDDAGMFNTYFSTASPETKYRYAHPDSPTAYDIYVVRINGAYIIFSTANAVDFTGTTNYIAWTGAWQSLSLAKKGVAPKFYFRTM